MSMKQPGSSAVTAMRPAPCCPVLPCPWDAENLTDSVPDAQRPLHCFLEAIAEGNMDIASSSDGDWPSNAHAWSPGRRDGGLPQQPVPALQGASSAWHPTTAAGVELAPPAALQRQQASASADVRQVQEVAPSAAQRQQAFAHAGVQPLGPQQQQAFAETRERQLLNSSGHRKDEVVASLCKYLDVPAGETEKAFSERLLMRLPDMMHFYEQQAEERRSQVLWKKRIDAVVGDRLNELYLAMECMNNGLTSQQYDALRRQLLSTKGLCEGRGRTEAQGRAKHV